MTNFKTRVEIELNIELEAFLSGEKRWTVSNQFDESVLESALENMDNMPESQWEWWSNSEAYSPMSIAHALSQYEAPELNQSWVN